MRGKCLPAGVLEDFTYELFGGPRDGAVGTHWTGFDRPPQFEEFPMAWELPPNRADWPERDEYEIDVRLANGHFRYVWRAAMRKGEGYIGYG